MISVGELLRRARVEQGLSLEDLAVRTRISVKLLHAIEADATDVLPGDFFYKSFVRQYASALKVTDPSIEQALDVVSATPNEFPLNIEQRRAPERPARRSNWREGFQGDSRTQIPSIVKSLAGLLVVVSVCSGIYTWWIDRKQEPAPAMITAPKLVEKPAVVAPPVQQAHAIVAEVTQAPEAESAVSVEPASPAVINPDDPIEIEIAANEATWLSISADGKRVFSGTLQARDTKEFQGASTAKIVIGNAGGLNIRCNGKPLGPIGPRGQVRTVLFSDKKIEIVGPGTEGNT